MEKLRAIDKRYTLAGFFVVVGLGLMSVDIGTGSLVVACALVLALLR